MGYKFVGRTKELEKFRSILNDKKALKYNIVGKPGIGKSTLMLEFIKMCDDAKYPLSRVNLDGNLPTEGLTFLKELLKLPRNFYDIKSKLSPIK